MDDPNTRHCAEDYPQSVSMQGWTGRDPGAFRDPCEMFGDVRRIRLVIECPSCSCHRVGSVGGGKAGVLRRQTDIEHILTQIKFGGTIWPNSTRFCLMQPHLVDIGQNSPNTSPDMAEFEPTLVELGPTLVELGQIGLKSGEIWSTSAKFGWISWQVWSRLSEFGWLRAASPHRTQNIGPDTPHPHMRRHNLLRALRAHFRPRSGCLADLLMTLEADAPDAPNLLPGGAGRIGAPRAHVRQAPGQPAWPQAWMQAEAAPTPAAPQAPCTGPGGGGGGRRDGGLAAWVRGAGSQYRRNATAL